MPFFAFNIIIIHIMQSNKFNYADNMNSRFSIKIKATNNFQHPETFVQSGVILYESSTST